MPPRIPRGLASWSSSSRPALPPRNQQICLLCSIAQAARPRAKRANSPRHRILARQQSTSSTFSAETLSKSKPSPNAARTTLRNALLELQKNAASYVNISRLQLALRGLEQEAGDETIRVAILGLGSLHAAKALVKLLVADPLKAEEEWERILLQNPEHRPLMLKVGHNGGQETTHGNRVVQEIHISSPMLNGHKLELLILGMDTPPAEMESFEDVALVPTMEIPTSSTGRYTPVTTPVHKSLVVADGLIGAANVIGFPETDRNTIGIAVNLAKGRQESEELPFQAIDLPLATEALQSFRKSVDNALVYEENWFKSGLPDILQWVRAGTAPTEEAMKQPLRQLIESVLENAARAISAEQSRQLSLALAAKVSQSDMTGLKKELADWAERAHTELRDQLDIAFNGRRWRMLGWWKLFWRVDDVSMLSTDILNQRFLPAAEREVIFLAGRIGQAGLLDENKRAFSKSWAWIPEPRKIAAPSMGSAPPPPVLKDLVETPKDHLPITGRLQPWPLHIPATRTYLAQETVPRLQALAQKLVFQTLGTSSFFTALGGLVYVSSAANTLYEAGAVAALGIVFSLHRMQGKWETARRYWEGEVREEGRKAVRGVEGVVTDVFDNAEKPLEQVDVELDKALSAVNQAQTALEETK